MATCYRCKDMKGGKRRFCRHTRPKPCLCGGMVGDKASTMPHRRGSKSANHGACEAHPDSAFYMYALLEKPVRKA